MNSSPIEVDWGAAREAFDTIDEVDVLPEGTWAMRCVKAEWQESKAGNPMIVSTHEAQGSNADDVWAYHVYMPDKKFTIANLYAFCAAHGVYPERLAAQGVPPAQVQQQVVEMLVGNVATCEVEHDEFGGRTRAQIKSFEPVPANSPEQSTGNVTQLDAARSEWESANTTTTSKPF